MFLIKMDGVAFRTETGFLNRGAVDIGTAVTRLEKPTEAIGIGAMDAEHPVMKEIKPKDSYMPRHDPRLSAGYVANYRAAEGAELENHL